MIRDNNFCDGCPGQFEISDYCIDIRTGKSTCPRDPKNKVLKHFDAFAGYGGFSIACERCGIETIGISEVNPFANQVLRYNFPGVKNYGDITKIKTEDLPDFDLLTGGSPCQDLSVAGKREGLQGERSSLFFHFTRILREKKPAYFLWENVKGALSSNRGHDFTTILNTLSESGYSIWWQVLNATWFGIPQNRERVFVVGVRNGSPRQVFFEPEDSTEDNGIQGQQTNTITARYHGAQATGSYIIEREFNAQERLKYIGGVGEPNRIENRGTNSRNYSQGNRVYDPEGIAVNINANGGGLGAKTGLYFIGSIGTGKSAESRGKQVYDPEGVAVTLAGGPGGLGVCTGLYAIRSCGDKGKQRYYESDEVGSLAANPQSDMIPMIVCPVLTPDRAEKRQNGRRIKNDGEEMFTLTAQDKHGIMIAPVDESVVGKKVGNFGSNATIKSTDDVADSLVAGCSGGGGTVNRPHILEEARIRRLTPRECERLMDLPDDWTRFGLLSEESTWDERVEISDTQRYKMCGNGIVVVCAEAVIKEIILGGS